ncbi:hypothetical protein FG05_35353 [Fusarium graminearum]|nr:hypothetical protein FG05_35353 [Fusarium graminearum]
MDGKEKGAIDAKPNPHIFTVVSQHTFTCQSVQNISIYNSPSPSNPPSIIVCNLQLAYTNHRRQTVLLVQSNKKYPGHVSNSLDQKLCIEKKRLEEEELKKKKNK